MDHAIMRMSVRKVKPGLGLRIPFGMKNGDAISHWRATQISSSSSTAPVTFSQPVHDHQPTLFQEPAVSHTAPSEAWVKFNGSASLSTPLPLPATKTVVTVARPGPDAAIGRAPRARPFVRRRWRTVHRDPRDAPDRGVALRSVVSRWP